MTIYPATYEAKIGFDTVRRHIARHCECAGSEELAAQMTCLTDYDAILRSLTQTAQMRTALSTTPAIPLDTPPSNVRKAVLAARVPGAFMDIPDLVALRRLAQTAAALASWRRALTPERLAPIQQLAECVEEIADLVLVQRLIDSVVDKSAQVKDNASTELAQIRSQLHSIGGRIASAMRRVVARGIAEGYLEAGTTPAVRDGRLVVPVAPMHKRSVSGIVHDESASGKTYFIEPAEVVELNNRQRELELEERREVIRILVTLTDQLRPHADSILHAESAVVYLDFLRAKARYAVEIEANLPTLHAQPEIEWYGARHPVLLLSLRKQGRETVPLDLHLTPEQRILIVSGPNAGGKSVALKTVGLIQYMTQCGVLPPVYENSHMGIFHTMFADIGDDQSIEDDLSTYSSHLRNMRWLLTHGNSRTLMLMDEFGTGTEPQIGGAIAQALLMRFNASGAWGVITTHYQNIKKYAEETPGLLNGSMLYDRQLMKPLFRLSPGTAGSSFAIEIARKSGLPDDVIADASNIVGSDYVNLDKFLLDVARDKRYWENKRQQVKRREKHLEEVIARYEKDAEELRTNRRAILHDAQQQASQIIAGSNASIERTIRDIRNAQAQKEATRAARQRLAHDANQLAEGRQTPDEHHLLKKAPKAKKAPAPAARPKATAQVEVGQNVLLDNAGQPGTVISMEGNKALVAFGALKMTVPVARLTPTIRKASSGAKAASFVSAATTDAMREKQLSFKAEIDVRGMRADEALQAVTYFVDDALQLSQRRVRILHGTGTGALRQAIRQYLATVPGIVSAHDEDVRFGGAGITVVNM